MTVTVTYCPDAFSRPDMSRRKLRLGRRKKSRKDRNPKSTLSPFHVLLYLCSYNQVGLFATIQCDSIYCWVCSTCAEEESSQKSHHSKKKDLLLCLNDLSMCDDDDPSWLIS